jgi:TRAP-type C4-dicarboxylate transport system permease small subunit
MELLFYSLWRKLQSFMKIRRLSLNFFCALIAVVSLVYLYQFGYRIADRSFEKPEYTDKVDKQHILGYILNNSVLTFIIIFIVVLIFIAILSRNKKQIN